MTIHQVDPVLRPVRQALSLQYQASLPLRADSFLWPSPEALVQLLPRLEQDLFGPPTTGERSLVRPAPPYQYRRSFIKHLMSRLQSAIDQAQRDHLPGAEDLVRAPPALSLASTNLSTFTRKCLKGSSRDTLS